MGHHRASRSIERSPGQDTRLPGKHAAARPSNGKRRATKGKEPRERRPIWIESSPLIVGVAAMALSVGASVSTANPTSPEASAKAVRASTAVSGEGRTLTPEATTARSSLVSRAGSRTTPTFMDKKAVEAVERKAGARTVALGQMEEQAREYASLLEATQWTLPLDPVVITAEFGDYGLWADYHTGIDFNGETGDPIMAVAGGLVTYAGYEGAYGFKTVVTLADGTEIWYAHQDSLSVTTGDRVEAGQVIGTVGATGNVTGSHLHLEVRPGGGDPVDPRAAFRFRGLTF